MQGTATLARNKHLYNVLGLADFSSIDEIRTAYKALALRYHPDKTLGDPVLTEKYKEIKLVYELLSNEEQKKQYDTSLRLFQAYTHVRVNGERGPLTGRTRSSYATYRGNAYSNNNASMATGATPRSARTTKEDATRRAAYANGHAENTTTTATATATTGGSFGSPSHNNNTTASNGSNGAAHPMSYEELYRQRYPFAFASTPTTNHTTAAGSNSNKTEAYAHYNNNNNTSANMGAGQASSARGAAEYVNHAAGTATNATPHTPNNNTTTASSNTTTTTAAGASTPLGSHYTAEQQELFRRREKERRAELKRQLEKERELRREEERAAARRAQEKRQELLQRRWFEQQQAFSAAQRGSRSRTASNTSHTSHRRRFNSLHTSSKQGAAGSAAANSSSPLFPSSPLFTQNSSYNSNNNNAAPSVPGSNYTTAASNAAAFTGLMRGATTTTTNNSNSGASMNLPAKEAAIRVPELNLGNLARELHRMNIHAARTARVGPTTTTATSRTATKAAAAAGVHGTERIRRTASEASAIAPQPAEPMMTMMRLTAPFHTTLRRTASSVVFSATNTSTTSCSPTAMTPTMGWQAGVQERNAHTAVGSNAQAVYSTYHYYTNESSSNNSNNTTTTSTTASIRNTAAAAAKEGSGPERVRRMQTARVRTTPAREFVLPQTAVSASTTKEKDKEEEDEEEREIAKSCEGEDQLARHVQPSTSPTSHETAQTSSQNGAVYSPANSTSAAAMHATNETFIVKVQGGANAEEGPRSTSANTPSALPRRTARSATSATRPSVVINAAALVNTNHTSQADSQADKKKNNNNSSSSSGKEEQDTSYHSNTNHTSSAATPGTRRRTRSQVSRAKSRKATSRERTHSYTASAVPEETPARLLILLQEDEQIERGQLIGAEEAQAWARLQRSLQQYTEQSLLQRLVPQENKARASIAYEAYQGREYLSLLGAELRERAAVMRNEAQQRRQMAGSAAHDYYFALQRADGASRFAFAERYRMARMPQPSPTRRTNTSSDSGGAKKGVVVVHTVDSEPFACDDQPTHKTSVAAADVTRALHNANKTTTPTPRTTTTITAPHTEAKTSAVGRETSVLSGPVLSQLAAREASARLALAQVEDADMMALLHWQANARHRRYSAEKAAAVRLVVLRHQQQMHELQEQVRALQDRLARYEQADKVRSSETSALAKNNNTTATTSVTGVTRTTMTTVTNTSTNAVRQNTPAATGNEQQAQAQAQQAQRGPMSPVTPRRPAVKVRNHNGTTATTAAGGGKGKETVNSSSDSSLVFSIHSA